MKKTTLFFVLCLLSVGVSAKKKLIVVLVDGFRWDYIDDPRLNLKGIPRIIKNGVRASYVNPVYPSLSYPNWLSIVTGLYPENHGFVNNVMYDEGSGGFFLMVPNPNSTNPFWWNEAEPIWITAEKNNLKSALYWWAGCEVEIKGTHPTICERERFGPVSEDDNEDFLERVDDLVEMFKPSRVRSSAQGDRMSLAMMYYGSVDFHSHHSGPDSPEVRKAVLTIDGLLDKMLNKLEKANLLNEVNIMVVSDHGLTDVSKPKYIDLEKFAPDIKYQVSNAAQSMLVPEEGMLDKLYKGIVEAKIPGLHIYKKEDIPKEYHIKRSLRVNQLFVEADVGYYIKALKDRSKMVGDSPPIFKGHHGYDPNKLEDMRAIFFATGPDFRRGQQLQNISNVDLYNMMCTVLDMEPLPNNGSWERVKAAFRKDEILHFKSGAATIEWPTILTSVLISFAVIAMNVAQYAYTIL